MWRNILLVAFVFLLLSLPIFSDVVLEDQEWEELNMIWTELVELVEQQEMELEFLTMQLTAVSKEISELQAYLKRADQSLTELQKEHKRKIVTWVAISAVFSGFAGLFAGIMLE